MSVIRFDVEPGVVSAIYFIIFDLFMLAIVDIVLIHVVSWMYHKRIHKGIPLEIRSAEIPGVATSLVGRFLSPPNLFAYSIKIALLACILIVDINIESESTRDQTRLDLTGTFEFNPSDDEWNTQTRRVVERRWAAIRRCNIINQDKTNITFYSIAFNLLGENKSIPNEVKDLSAPTIPINDSSVTCLARDKVDTNATRVLASVVGCSQLEPTTCLNETVIERQATLSLVSSDELTVILPEGSRNISFSLHKFNEEAAAIWPEYESPTLTCMRTGFGFRANLTTRRIVETCLVISVVNNSRTLIERWEYNRKEEKLSRRFPGPIFDSIIDIGLYQRATILTTIVSELNWVSFSGQVIADGVIYKRIDFKVFRLSEPKKYTTVPVYTTVLTILLMIAAGAARLAVAFSIGSDLRPRLNTINGLSSVAREENEPTGRSMQTGQGMVIGLTNRHGRSVHFGPLTSRDKGVARERGVTIE